MKLNKLLVCVVAIASASLVVGCGVEGNYTLDKAETKKAFEADIAKMPATDQEFAKLGLNAVDTMDMSLELKSGGVASMKMTKGTDTKDEAGTWKKEGDDIVITLGTDDKGAVKCQKSGKKLTCSKTNSKNANTMVFMKS